MDSPQYHPQYFTATILDWQHLLNPDKYKDIIIQSFQFLVKEKRIEHECICPDSYREE